MLRRNTVAVEYCFNRAAECEKLAELAPDRSTRVRYRQLAAAWLRLARNAQFTERLEAHLAAEKPSAPDVAQAHSKAREYELLAAAALDPEEKNYYERISRKWLGIADGWRVISEIDKS
jgi:hypothetical protein